MTIPEEDVAHVRAATDMAAVVGEHTALKRVGRRLVGLCPFHSERSPSFSVNATEGLYYCFGCQASGDAISFVRAVDGLDFVEAVERLAARAGVTIRRDASGSGSDVRRDRQQALYDAMSAAVDFYQERLVRSPDGGEARRYLRGRGYDGDVVRQFKLGWAPTGWDDLVLALSPKHSDRALRDTGLAYVKQRGRLQDAFRGRVIFPIFDTSGRAIALGGRVLDGGGGAGAHGAARDGGGANGSTGPKYRNSAETPIYSKRRTLYGLNWAKVDLPRSKEVIVCEGYTDVIGFFVAGLPRAVASCGTALTEDHLRILSRFAKRVVLAFDADAAGQSAAARIYEWERRHELEIAVARLPPGSDPADLARDDPDSLQASVNSAVPFLAFRIGRAMEDADLSTAEGRVRAAEAAIATIAEHPNELVRDQYIVEVSDRTRVPPDQLRVRLTEHRSTASSRGDIDAGEEAGSRSPRWARHDDGDPGPIDPEGPSGGVRTRRGNRLTGDASRARGDGARDEGGRAPPGRMGLAGSGTRTVTSTVSSGSRPGLDALLLLAHRREEIAPYLSADLFADDLQRRSYQAISSSPNLHEAIESAEADVADLISQIAVTEPDDEVDGTVIALALVSGDRVLTDLQAEARLAEAGGDRGRLAAIAAETDWLKDVLGRLTADGAIAALTEPLVAWLSRRQGEGA